MRNLFKFILFIFFCLAFQYCTPLYKKQYNQAKENYERGQFRNSISNCLYSLNNNPDYEETHILLENSYKRAIEENLNNIKGLKGSKPKFYWDDIYSNYYSCIKLNNQIAATSVKLNESLISLMNINEDIFYGEIEGVKNNAAEQHYLEGKKLSESMNVDNQKNAAKQFTAVMNYIPDYKDASDCYNKCKSNAIKRIAIIPFVDKTNKHGNYGGISDKLIDNILSDLFNDTQASEFIELITRDQIENVIREQHFEVSDLVDPNTAIKLGKILGVHEIIVGKITQIIYSPEKTSNRSFVETKKVVIGEKIVGYYSDTGKPQKEAVWGDVHAKVSIYKKNSYAQINGSFNIIEAQTGKLKKTGACTGKNNYEYEFGKFDGDERALSYESSNLCQKSEEFSPVEEQLVDNALDNLSLYLFNLIKEYTK